MPGQEIQAVREMLASFPDSSALALQELRVVYDGFNQIFPPPDGISIDKIDADGLSGEWVRAANASRETVILYLHGGGYLIGSPTSHRHLTAAISQATGAAVLALDYRLAPEQAFPGAVEDAVAAYRWLLAQGIPANKIVIAGDSAGGGLTVATLIALRDAGVELPAGGVCISPWADLTNSAESFNTKASTDPICSREMLNEMAKAYLQGKDAKTPLASPVYADLTGLPPLLIQVGTEEVLLDDSFQLEQRAKDAGVNVTLEVCDEMIHVWHFFHPMLKEGREAIARLSDFFKTQTAG
jgi:phosphinothricin tripeptide acetyl hydrolase